MAFATGAAIDGFQGTFDGIDSSSSAVSGNAFSVAADVSTWTNTENAQQAALSMVVTFATQVAVGDHINVYGRRMNVNGTTDEVEPSASYRHPLCGVLPIGPGTSSQQINGIIDLPNMEAAQEYDFYFEVVSSQTMSSGWTAHINNKATEPAA
jgi:hypothetical protein